MLWATYVTALADVLTVNSELVKLVELRTKVSSEVLAVNAKDSGKMPLGMPVINKVQCMSNHYIYRIHRYSVFSKFNQRYQTVHGGLENARILGVCNSQCGEACGQCNNNRKLGVKMKSRTRKIEFRLLKCL